MSLTRALERDLRITPSGGGRHIMPPIDFISSYESCRDEFWGMSRATLELFLAKILGPWVNPFKIKKGEFSKC